MRKLFKERKLFKGGNYMRKYGISFYCRFVHYLSCLPRRPIWWRTGAVEIGMRVVICHRHLEKSSPLNDFITNVTTKFVDVHNHIYIEYTKLVLSMMEKSNAPDEFMKKTLLNQKQTSAGSLQTDSGQPQIDPQMNPWFPLDSPRFKK